MNRARAKSYTTGRTTVVIGLLAAGTVVDVKYAFTRNGCHWFTIDVNGHTIDCPEHLLADLK